MSTTDHPPAGDPSTPAISGNREHDDDRRHLSETRETSEFVNAPDEDTGTEAEESVNLVDQRAQQLAELEEELAEAAYEPGHDRGYHGIGRDPSPARVDDALYRLYQGLAREAERRARVERGGLPNRRYAELREQAAEELQADQEQSMRDERVRQRWAPTSRYEDEPTRASETPVFAAVMADSLMRFLLGMFASRSGERGRSPARRLLAAMLALMAFKRGRPTLCDARQAFDESAAALAFAFGYPNDPLGPETPPKGKALYEAFHEMLQAGHVHPEDVEHFQVAAFRRLADLDALDDEGRPVLDAKGRRVKKHPNAGKVVIVDGSFVEGQAKQVVPLDEVHRQILIRGRADRQMIRYVTYTRNGRFTKGVLGYKLVALVCGTTGRPIITLIMPASWDERKATLHLLNRLFTIWPECPAEFIVGDGLYGHATEFLKELMFRWGLDPVFPWRQDYPTHEHHKKGVPVCYCAGLEHPTPMRFKQRKGAWWGHERRRKHNLPRGQWAPRSDWQIRYEFECSFGNPGCKNKTTKPINDPRVFTYLPHTGEGKQASMRRVFLRQRNIVESYYASLMQLGLKGRGINRPAWASDVEVALLLQLGSLYLTLRRYVFDTGQYHRALVEYEQLGLRESPGLLNPSPGPSSEQLRALMIERAQRLEPAAPPASLVQANGGVVPRLTGSGETWIEEWTNPVAAFAAREARRAQQTSATDEETARGSANDI